MPCPCVSRAIFKACFTKFRRILEKEKSLTHVSLDAYGQGAKRGYVWGRKDEEFIADFYLLSRRALTEAEWKIFSFRHLLGADWRLCCQRLGMDRGTFHRHLYRVEEKLGLIYRETQPYPLFPFDEYFVGTSRRHIGPTRVRLREDRPGAQPKPLRPPLAA